MMAFSNIILICILLQVSVIYSLPIPPIAEDEIPVVIKEEHAVIQSASPADLPVDQIIVNGNPDNLSPSSILSDAALSSILQLVQKSLMSLNSPSSLSAGMFPLSGIPDDGGEVKETIVAPGTTLRIIHRTFNPPVYTTVTSGQDQNKVTQKQMYGEQNFTVLQSGFNDQNGSSSPPEVPAPEVIDVQTEEFSPRDFLSELAALDDTVKNSIEKLNHVLE